MKRCSPLLLAALLLGCGKDSASRNVSTDVAKPPAAQEADAANAPAGETTADVPLSIVSFDEINEHVARNAGRVVVMDAWSTSCPPCMKEFHNLVELHKKYPDQVSCISLSFDYEGLGTPEEQRQPVLAFLRQQGATFDNLMSNEESDVLYRKFKLASVPAVFVYDKSGKLRKRFDNEKAKTKDDAFTYAQVGQLVAELLAEKEGETKTE